MPEGEESETLRLHNDNFVQNHKQQFKNFLHSQDLTDVTLACEGQFIKSHRLVLAASSPFFSDMFKLCGLKDPIVVLNDVSVYHMKAILQYIYTGECQVQQDEVITFLKVADSLLIHGLHDKDKRETESTAAKPTCVTEETPGSVATPHEEEQELLPVEEVNIKEEIPEFENPVQPEQVDIPPGNLPLNAPVTATYKTEMMPTAVIQNPVHETYNVPVIPIMPATRNASVSINILPKFENSELDGRNDGRNDRMDESLYEYLDPRSRTTSLPCGTKRKRLTNAYRDDLRNVDSMDFSRVPQPGPSNPPSTSRVPIPSTSQDFTFQRQSNWTRNCSRRKATQNQYNFCHQKSYKPYQCRLCYKSFNTRKGLKEHTFVVHEEKHVACIYENCGVMFRNTAQMKKHVRRVHRSANN